MDTTMIKECIKLLYVHKDLTSDQISKCLEEIMTNKATPAQVGAFLMLLQSKTLNPAVIYRSADTMLQFALKCDVREDCLDIVGTGGESVPIDSFNASTAAAFVVASSDKIKVAKHGNRSSSGKCGAADFMEAIGARIDLLNESLLPIIKDLGFGFLFAQKFHPSMKSVASIRKELGVRTIFNILGPLMNPANPNFVLAGVGTESLGSLYAQVFALKGYKRAMVVHSLDGLDEISTATETKYWMVENGNVREGIVSPRDFGLNQPLPIHLIAGSTPQNNAAVFREIIRQTDIPNTTERLSQEQLRLYAITEFVVINAAAAFVVIGAASTWSDGAKMARELICSGKVERLVDGYIKQTNY